MFPRIISASSAQTLSGGRQRSVLTGFCGHVTLTIQSEPFTARAPLEASGVHNKPGAWKTLCSGFAAGSGGPGVRGSGGPGSPASSSLGAIHSSVHNVQRRASARIVP